MEKERSLEGFIDGIEKLPTLPGIAMQILEAVQNEEPNIDEISDIISTDPPLSVKVLSLVNSSFYNLPAKITSVLNGIKMLGINTVKNIALGFSLVNTYQSQKSNGFDYTCFWNNLLNYENKLQRGFFLSPFLKLKLQKDSLKFLEQHL